MVPRSTHDTPAPISDPHDLQSTSISTIGKSPLPKIAAYAIVGEVEPDGTESFGSNPLIPLASGSRLVEIAQRGRLTVRGLTFGA